MTSIRFILLSTIVPLLVVVTVSIFNFFVDPYNFYGNNHLNLAKTQEGNQIRLSKAVTTENINPRSIVLGTSRSEFGYDPSHEYFQQPAYNLAVGGASMAEALAYLKHANAQGRLENVLLVADYIMFNSNEQYKTNDFDTYFNSPNLYKYLLGLNTLKSSLLTLYGTRADKYTIYNSDGQREHTHNATNLERFGGQKKLMLRQSDYFKNFDNNDHYSDSGTSAFTDFKEFVNYCQKEGLVLDIIFGPNHVLHWEAFDHDIGLDKWYLWKKDIVKEVDLIVSKSSGESIRVIDFAIYNKYTVESIPVDTHENMMFHWEQNHYKTELGDLALNDLLLDQPQLGALLTSKNIDSHIRDQARTRTSLIAVNAYRKNVLINRSPGDWNQYLLKDQ